MNYTKKYSQVSKAAAKAKYARMASEMGRQATVSSFECGFSTWWMGKDITDNASPRDLEDCDDYAIYVSSTYHAESTLDDMYKTNCKKW